MCSIHTTECYSAVKRKEILTQATTRANLEEITLGEISPSQNHKYRVVPLNEVLRGVRFTETESRAVGWSGWGGGDGELVFNGG